MADDTPAVEAVMRADKERWALVKEEKALLAALEKEPDEAKDARLAEVYEQMAAIGADRAEAKARRILYGLGFDAEMQVKPTKNFSGGWRMRISLARALFLEPTLLMLDGRCWVLFPSIRPSRVVGSPFPNRNSSYPIQSQRTTWTSTPSSGWTTTYKYARATPIHSCIGAWLSP